jgi:predicted nuclease of predicted toxin-antitoxin system
VLLFDQNLSFKLCKMLHVEFPNCRHVREVALSQSDDAAIWKFAALSGLTLVSKDQDFRQRSALFGAPPKCVWVRLGNCSTAEVAALLRRRANLIHEFCSIEAGLLILDRAASTIL